MTMEMCQNILLSSFKGEHPRHKYYLLSTNIYGLGIHDAYNNICSVYTWNEFKGNNGINNIAYCLLIWINDRGYYSQSYGKNHNMSEIDILLEKCGGYNRNNVIILFLNMIKEGGLFQTSAIAGKRVMLAKFRRFVVPED